MVFWKKRIELPQAIYEAAGECILYYLESCAMAQTLGFRRDFDPRIGLALGMSSSMTFDQAYELLDVIEKCSVRLRALLSEFPIRSGSSFEVRDNTLGKSIQDCEEMKKAILALSEFERSLPIRQYSGRIHGQDAAHFEHLVVVSAEWLGVEQAMANKIMAKAANISSDEFVGLAAQTVKDTPRGMAAFAQAKSH